MISYGIAITQLFFKKIRIKYYLIWKDIVKFKPLSFTPGRAFDQLNPLTSFRILNGAILVHKQTSLQHGCSLFFWKHFQMRSPRAHSSPQGHRRKRRPPLPNRPKPQHPQLGEGDVWPTLPQLFPPGKMMSTAHLQSRTVHKDSLVPLVYPNFPQQAQHLPGSIAAVFSRRPRAVPTAAARPRWVKAGPRVPSVPLWLRAPFPALR